MRDTLPGFTVRHRIKGRAALVRRLHGLRLAVSRFARHRATAPQEQAWAARLADALDLASHQADDTQE